MREIFIEYWTDLLLSGSESLIQAGRVTPEIVEQMRHEMQTLKKERESVIFYSWILARAEAY
jgi:hypothetical protein